MFWDSHHSGQGHSPHTSPRCVTSRTPCFADSGAASAASDSHTDAWSHVDTQSRAASASALRAAVAGGSPPPPSHADKQSTVASMVASASPWHAEVIDGPRDAEAAAVAAKQAETLKARQAAQEARQAAREAKQQEAAAKKAATTTMNAASKARAKSGPPPSPHAAGKFAMLDRLVEAHAQDREVSDQHMQQLQRAGTVPTPNGQRWPSAILLILLLSCALSTVYGCILLGVFQIPGRSDSRAAKHSKITKDELLPPDA
jgi:cobalamin biosynthesis Mg chelatase CobN